MFFCSFCLPVLPCPSSPIESLGLETHSHAHTHARTEQHFNILAFFALRTRKRFIIIALRDCKPIIRRSLCLTLPELAVRTAGGGVAGAPPASLADNPGTKAGLRWLQVRATVAYTCFGPRSLGVPRRWAGWWEKGPPSAAAVGMGESRGGPARRSLAAVPRVPDFPPSEQPSALIKYLITQSLGNRLHDCH